MEFVILALSRRDLDALLKGAEELLEAMFETFPKVGISFVLQKWWNVALLLEYRHHYRAPLSELTVHGCP